MSRRHVVAAVAGAALALAVALPAAANDAYAITGARIVTLAGPVIEKGTVVIAAGKFAAVGPDVAVPPGATVVDGTGKTVYPGLIDALNRIGLTEIEAVRASMDTTEVGDVNPDAKAWVALNPHSELVAVARANGVTLELAAPSGGPVSGQAALVRLTGSTPDAMTERADVALAMAWPSGRAAAAPDDEKQEPRKLDLEERLKEKKRNQEKDLQRLADLFEDAKAYAAAVEAAAAGRAEAPKPDPRLAALAPYAGGERPVVLRADSEDDIRGAVAFAGERGLKLVVAGGLEAWRCAELLKQKGVPVLIEVLRLPERRSDPYDAAYANAAILERAGVRFAIVTDNDQMSRNLPYEAAMAHAFGLGAEAALRAITLSPAEILGVADRVGSIAPGKDANLVVANGDILDARTAVTAVFIDGVPQSLETRHTRLYQEFKDRP